MSSVLPQVPESCLVCGACCIADLPEYVRVHGDDYARLGDAAEEWTTWSGNRCFMRMEDGHCAALEVDAETGEVPCRIYPLRPTPCRAFERGSPQCLGELTTKADRARALREKARTRHATASDHQA